MAHHWQRQTMILNFFCQSLFGNLGLVEQVCVSASRKNKNIITMASGRNLKFMVLFKAEVS